MSLNDSKIRKLKTSSRPVKLSDSHGLYLLVNPGGSRIWYLKYRFNGKESRVSLGAYPPDLEVQFAYRITDPFCNMDTVIYRFEAAACFLRQGLHFTT